MHPTRATALGAAADETRVRVELHPGDQDRYVAVPFAVPGGVESVAAEIAVDGPDGTMIDLGLHDPDGTRGWSGGSHRTLRVALEQASPGYRPGPLPAGEWAVILGAYKVPAPGCAVDVMIRRTRPATAWLRGDLHIHTTHSDGNEAPPHLAGELAALGLDFVGLTDHNTTSTLASFPKDSPVLAMPGIEWTTPRGHVNLIGVERPLRDVRSAGRDDVVARLAEARDNGAFASVNHAFEDSCKGCPWDWGFEPDLAIDAIEIWNGIWRPNNRRTLAFWQAELVRGRRLVATGGTDFHAVEPLTLRAMPTTWALAHGLSHVAVLEALRAGRVSISVGPGGPLVEVTCGAAMQGDEVAGPSAPAVAIEATGLRPGDRLELWSDRGLEGERPADGTDLAVTVEPGGRRFWRAEVWRACPILETVRPVAFTNPVFFAPT